MTRSRASPRSRATRSLRPRSPAYDEARRLGEQLAEAVQRRAVIEQAKGVLMGKIDDLGPEGAFTLLARAAQRQDATLREIAQRVVDERDPTVDHA